VVSTVSTPWKTLVNWDVYSQIFPVYGKIKAMFQTTNQIIYKDI
jgi:hypothetical protein